MSELLDNDLVLVAVIFLARVIDVALGTIRTILVFRGHKYLAAVTGFFEILVWVVAVSQVIQNLDSWYLAVAYAVGFAAGTIVGIFLEGKLAIGTELIRAVSKDGSIGLAKKLRHQGYEVIEIIGSEGDAPVEVLLVVEKRRRVPALLRSIDAADPDAYYTISDVKEMASEYRGVKKLKPAIQRGLKRK